MFFGQQQPRDSSPTRSSVTEVIRTSSLAKTRTVPPTEILCKTGLKSVNARYTVTAAVCQNSTMFSREEKGQSVSQRVWFVWV